MTVQTESKPLLASPENVLNQEFILVIDDDIVFINYLKNVLEKKVILSLLLITVNVEWS